MINLNWDENAKAAAMEFACYIGKAKDCERYFKHIAQKTKTVADAVEYYNGAWPEEKDAVCVWDDKNKNFEFWISDYEPVSYCYEVCNYEQFEAYVKEQEGEKWTHAYSDYGVRKDCILIHDKPDIHGQVLVVNRYDEYVLTGTVEPKPINTKRFTFKDGFIYDGDIRMGSSDIVNVMNFMVDELSR